MAKRSRESKNLIGKNNAYHFTCVIDNIPNPKIAADLKPYALTYVFKCEPNMTYTYSCSKKGNRMGIYELFTEYTHEEIAQWNPNSNIYADLRIIGKKSGISEFTITTSSNAQMLVAYICNGSSENDVPTNPMLNEGSSPLPYEPYGTIWEPCAVKQYHVSKNKFDESQAEIISTASGDFYGVNMGILTGDYTFGAAMAARSTLYVQHGYITDAFTYPSDSMFINPYQFGDGEPVKIYTDSTTQTTFANEGITQVMMNEGGNETHYEPYGSWWNPCTQYVRRNGVWVPNT